MKPLRTVLLGLVLAVFLARAGEPEPGRRDAYLRRAGEVADWLGTSNSQGYYGLGSVAAKLLRNEDLDRSSQRVIELMHAPSGDVFWMLSCVVAAHTGWDKLSPEAQAAMRGAWGRYMPLRGNTGNHWVIYYSSLYLMAELWPDEAGDRWFTGKSSAENLAEAREFLVHWVEATTSLGQGEYDCTHYMGHYAITMLFLASWAEDPEMRKRGQMMLDYILADYAVDTLNGMYIGAHARTDDRGVLEKWNNLSSFFGWLFFDNCPPPADPGWGAYFAVAAHNYELPEVIYRIGTDRSQPYTARELKRSRKRLRNGDSHRLPVFKKAYVTKDYAIGSDQGGLFESMQQHSWDVTWAMPDPRGVHNTLFSVQPHYSSFALQMFYPRFPDWMPKAVTYQGKPSYLDEAKLLGGSPYEQVYQEDDALVSLTLVPAGSTFGHVNGFFSTDLARLEEDASGWIFAQGGNACIAYRQRDAVRFIAGAGSNRPRPPAAPASRTASLSAAGRSLEIYVTESPRTAVMWVERETHAASPLPRPNQTL